MRSRKTYLFFVVSLFVMLCFSCVTKRVDDGSAEIPPNVQIFYFPKNIVWKNLIQIIRNEYLIPFDYASLKRGYFVCQEIKNADDPAFKTKVRLSGSLTYDGRGTVVTMFKQIAVWNEADKVWQSNPTDYNLEVNILARLGQKLSQYKKR